MTSKTKTVRGPKAGQARSNQFVKEAPVTIKEIKGANNGETTLAILSNGKAVPIDAYYKAGLNPKVGNAWADVELALKVKGPSAQLARGVASRDAPHSSKALQDAKRPVKATEPAAAPKSAPRPANSAFDPKAKVALTTKGKARLEKKDSSNAWREMDMFSRAKTVAAAREAGLNASAMRYFVKTGCITIG